MVCGRFRACRRGEASFGKPLKVNARGNRDDNSWCSPGLKALTFGTGRSTTRKTPRRSFMSSAMSCRMPSARDFGQSVQAAAMGEGFGDRFAGSFFAAKKALRFRPAVMTWDWIAGGDGDPPCVRRLDEPLTFESFDFSESADENENGKIGSATMWDIWSDLGRDVADRIIIESHFQLDGFTTFARGARATLDADRNLFGDRRVPTLRRLFASRGIGPVQ
jgi:hypothetical protein